MRNIAVSLLAIILLFGSIDISISLENNISGENEYQANKKDILVAGIGDFFLTTLGHYYAGDWNRGLLFLGQEIGCIGLIGLGTVWGNSTYGFPLFGLGMSAAITGIVGLPSIRIMEIYDGVLTAEEKNKMLAERLELYGTKKAAMSQYFSEAKNPRIAAGNAFLLPSIGHYYAGDWGRGLDYLLKETLFFSIPAVWPAGSLVGVGGFTILRISEIFDAAGAAEDYNAKLRLKYDIKE